MKRLFVLAVISIIIAVGWRVQTANDAEVASNSKKGRSYQSQTGFNKQLYAIDQPGSVWWIVNKKRPLPEGYVPADLVIPNVAIRPIASSDEQKIRKDVAIQMEAMFSSAKQAGIQMMLASGYRSYQLQVTVYNSEVQRNGTALADQESAKPGTSEHQTGLAADVGPANRKCEIADCFADTPEGKWLAQHAHEFGFIVRYLPNKQSSTGYRYEPWHIRFVGQELSNELQKTGQTMEEFFGI